MDYMFPLISTRVINFCQIEQNLVYINFNHVVWMEWNLYIKIMHHVGIFTTLSRLKYFNTIKIAHYNCGII